MHTGEHGGDLRVIRTPANDGMAGGRGARVAPFRETAAVTPSVYLLNGCRRVTPGSVLALFFMALS